VRLLRNLTTGLGSLALAATLALISPGVHAVRAEDTAAQAKSPAAGDGTVCEAGLPAHADVVIVNHLQQMQRLHAQAVAASGRDAGSGVVVIDINSRGENYPTSQ
jgi:alpha-ketoglutarate-dependent taurine dioxygenase